MEQTRSICKFKVGDIVRVVRRGSFGWESMDWSQKLSEDIPYIVDYVSDDLSCPCLSVVGSNIKIHIDHFDFWITEWNVEENR